MWSTYPRIAPFVSLCGKSLCPVWTIDREVERVIPTMRARGGYIPTCDHGVPDNVTYESYRHYRRRLCELDH